MPRSWPARGSQSYLAVPRRSRRLLPIPSMKTFRTVAPSVVASVIAVAGLTSNALASDPAPKTSLVNLADEGNRWLLAATAGPTVASDPTARSTGDAPTAERAASAPAPQPFVDFLPNLSLIARDWRGSMKVVGARSMLVDDLRPTASNRMVVGRISTDARLSLFAQVGAGEWRIDTVMFPGALSYSKLAGQLGSGFEIRIAPRLRLAGEVQYTMLYADLHYSAEQVKPISSSGILAIAGTF